jgi:hypothetical protein
VEGIAGSSTLFAAPNSGNVRVGGQPLGTQSSSLASSMSAYGNYALINAPEPITTMCKDGFIASIPSLYVFLIDKGDKASAHPYNRVLARA